MDITIAELLAEIPAGDSVKAWWQSAAALPADATTNEFFLKTLKAAHDAARKKNANLSVGSRIDGYPAPIYNSTILDTNTGVQFQIITTSVKSRVTLNMNEAVSPLN